MQFIMGVPKWWNETHCKSCGELFKEGENTHTINITLNYRGEPLKITAKVCDSCYKKREDEIVVDGVIATDDELKLTSQYLYRLQASGMDGADMIRWARKELAKPDGARLA